MLVESLPEDLQKHEANLFAAVRDGLVRFKTEYAPLRPAMTKRSERSNIHDCIFAEAAKYFEITERLNLKTINLGTYRLKVKKFDLRLQPKNIVTQMVLDFMRQHLPAVLFDKDTIGLHLGYVPDDLDVAKSGIFVTQPQGLLRRPKWAYELTGGPALGAALPALPITPPNTMEPRKSRFIPKRDAEPKKKPGRK